MKLFVISDIHGSMKYIDPAASLIEGSDLVIIAGDISKSGEFDTVPGILEKIEKYNTKILAVPGNWDNAEVIELLENKGYSLHNTGRIINGIGFFGVGGSNKTPINSPTEYSEEKIMEFLENGYRQVQNAQKKILISHAPPKNTRDRTFLGMRVGSSSIRKFLEENTIDLCICGHIHEASGTDALNSGIILNPGSFRKGKYFTIETEGAISVEKGRVKT
ncbi:MAG: YfcE family phosphodiesterase [bacterium]|nr:YfcE family phosphodiesterase [bacterium]